MSWPFFCISQFLGAFLCGQLHVGENIVIWKKYQHQWLVNTFCRKFLSKCFDCSFKYFTIGNKKQFSFQLGKMYFVTDNFLLPENCLCLKILIFVVYEYKFFVSRSLYSLQCLYCQNFLTLHNALLTQSYATLIGFWGNRMQ